MCEGDVGGDVRCGGERDCASGALEGGHSSGNARGTRAWLTLYPSTKWREGGKEEGR